ncbi:unnamed protein product [Lactuca saligna]|uniref:Uncharacterized protein n=1 Tax=Lactuca saligna TaxID=75948 RepID=A0AA36A2D6_LACSI|nr:unnamed protein product [Lactuca saligna]
MCYEGTYHPTIKKLLPPFWRLLAHYFVIFISRRKGGSDEISQTTTLAIVALAMDWDYNFSRFLFEEMKSSLHGKKKDLFLMYPKKATKISYLGLKEFVKFGKFAEVKDTPTASSINVEIFEGHVAPIPKFQFAFEEVEVSDDEGDASQEKELTENEFDDFLQGISIPDDNIHMCESSKEPVNEAVISPDEIENEVNIFKQLNDPTPEQMDALISELQ